MSRGRKVLSLSLCMMLAVTMCFSTVTSVFAGTEAEAEVSTLSTEQAEPAEVLQSGDHTADMIAGAVKGRKAGKPANRISNGVNAADYYIGSITPQNINSIKSTGDVKYETLYATGRYYDMYEYTLKMPYKGAIVVAYTYLDESGAVTKPDSVFVRSTVSDAVFYGNEWTTTANGVKVNFRSYAVNNISGTTKLEIYANPGQTVVFSAQICPNVSNTVKASSTAKNFIRGGTADYSKVSQFKVTVPAKGYLDITAVDGAQVSYPHSVDIKLSGFKDYEILRDSTAFNTRTYVGVKKGTYTVKIKSSAAMIKFRIQFKKIGESSYGTKKGAAKALKKNSFRKGLIVTNAKKAHWYKIKNPKLQKVRILLNTKLSAGGSGDVKVAAYDKRGLIGIQTVDSTDTKTTLRLRTLGKNNRLVKGTYWIKVYSNRGGNGYFRIKWY